MSFLFGQGSADGDRATEDGGCREQSRRVPFTFSTTTHSLPAKSDKFMQRYVQACAAHPNNRRIELLVDDIIADAALHARFVNTLARMEYVGVRKLLKSRRSDRLDLDGLQHMLDENVHALRLKKAATALAASSGTRVATFSDDDTLAGAAGEAYLQALDHKAEAALLDLPMEKRSEANYLLTTAAIEVRAQVFYPVYDALLSARGVGFSVAAITRDEDRHLDQMAHGLERTFGDRGGWRARFEPLLADEQILFDGFLREVHRAVAIVRSA